MYKALDPHRSSHLEIVLVGMNSAVDASGLLGVVPSTYAARLIEGDAIDQTL